MDKRELGLNMTLTIKALGGKLGQNVKSNGIDLPMEQMITLEVINRNGQMILQEIAELLNKDKSGLLRIIDSLENKGFLERIPDAKDRRKKNLKVTALGNNVLKKVTNLEVDTISSALEGISDEELQIFNKCINKIKSNI